MRVRGIISTFAMAALLAQPAFALTMGEIGQKAFDLVETECSDAFERHMAFWPDEGAARDVVWRDRSILSSEQEVSAEKPALLDQMPRLIAWQFSGYALADDVTFAGVYATQDNAPSAEWLEQFAPFAESLTAASDIYDCARFSDEGFASVVQNGVGEGLLSTVATFDCLSRVSREMAGVYDPAADPALVHNALMPLVAEIDDCGGGQ